MKRFILTICLLILTGFSIDRVNASPSSGNIDASVDVERVTISKDGKLNVWNKEGRYLPTWPKDLASQNRHFSYSPRLIDLDLDRQDEVLAVSEDNDGGNLKLHVFKGEGSELSSWSFSIPDENIVDTPLIADVDHNSSLEIAYSTTDGNVRVYRRDFHKLSDFSKSLGGLPRLVIGDPDNDGLVDLYASSGGTLYGWDEKGGLSTILTLPAGEEIIGNVVLSDVDKNDYQEFVFTTTAGRILAVDRNGNIVMELHAPSGASITSGVIVADIDIDKLPELIILTNKRDLIAYRTTGEIVSSLTYKLDYRENALISGVVANDIYQGLFSSVTGWDQNVIYRNKHNSYSRIKLGENVREWDSYANFDFLEMIDVFDVFSFPKPFTPNGDGVNDTTTIHFRLSDDALVALDLYDGHERFISRIKDKVLKKAGEHAEIWSGVDNKGTATTNDDTPLGTGLYFVKVVAESKDGFVSTAATSVIVNGVKAEIETPKDENKQDSIYPKVYGKIGVTGIAIDPNFGENSLDADFQSYKLYYRPGVWTVTDEEILKVGEASSLWVPVEVPLIDQCPKNDYNEPIDSLYPHSNVSCRPVQHGILGIFDVSDISKTPNGEYTLLLKVMDSNGNARGKVSYDTLVVDVANPKPGDPFDPENPSDLNNPNNPIYNGPMITGASLSNSLITRQDASTAINYTLENETSNVYITIYLVDGSAAGSAVAVYSFKNLEPKAYNYVWNGTNALGRNVSGGSYRINISAYSVDGTGVDSNDSLTLSVAKGYSASDTLNIEEDPATGQSFFSVTPTHFDPLNFDPDLKAEKAFITYKLTKEAKVTVQVLEDVGNGESVLRKTLSSGEIKIRDNGNEYWDGTGDNGIVFPVDKDYVVRLTAEGIDIGNEEVIYRDIIVHLDKSTLDQTITANISQLIGDQGEVVNKGDPLKAIVGNPDFLWRASGSGYVEIPFSYTISASGTETYRSYASGTKSDKVFICNTGCMSGGGGCDPGEAGRPSIDLGIDLGVGFEVTKYGAVYNNYGGVATVTNKSYASGDQTFVMPPTSVQYVSPFSEVLKSSSSINFTAYTHTPTGDGLANICPIVQPDEWLTVCNRCSLYDGRKFCEYGYAMSTLMVDCGTITAYAEGEKEIPTQLWPPEGQPWPSISGNGYIVSTGANPKNKFAYYNGSVGSGAANTFLPIITQYALSVSNTVNGIVSTGSSSGTSVITLSSFQASLDANGYLSAGIPLITDPLTNFNTGSNDPYLAGTPYKKIWGSYNDFNDEYYKKYTDEISFYDDGYYVNIFSGNPGTNIYSFSDVVHLTSWNVDVRYPNVTVSKQDGDSPIGSVFELESPTITAPGVIGDKNSNTKDYFRLKLLPEATPRKFVEIRGSAGANYELYYYDNNEADPKWHPIEPRTHNPVSNGTLAHFDVTYLNGNNYTVALKTYNGSKFNIDTFNVGIGTLVDTSKLGSNEFTRVYSPFKRASLIFGEDSIENGPSLITINTIDKSSAEFTIPTGIAPIGPIFEIKPDDIQIDPEHHVQLEITYSADEITNPNELTIYNLAGDNVLEGLATVITFDDMDDSDPSNDVYRLTATLEHFSQYLVAKKVAGYFHLDSPVSDRSLSGIININGRVESAPRPVDQPDVQKDLASLTSLDIYYYPEGDTSAKVEMFSTSQGSPTTSFSQIDVAWNAEDLNGNYILRFDAVGPQGIKSSYEIPVAIDNTPSQSTLIINGKAVTNGGTEFVATGAVLEIKAGDSSSNDWQSGVKSIEYALDGGEYIEYQQPISIYLSSGSHSIIYHAVDQNDNLEADKTATIVIQEKMSQSDSDDISLKLNVSGPKYVYNGQTWVSGSSIFEIVSTSGIFDHSSYRVDDSEYVVYSEPFSVEGDVEGVYIVEYFAVDKLGLRSQVNTLPVLLDVTSPYTSMAVDGSSQVLGADLIVTPDTSISLSSVDFGDSPVGLSRIEYKLGDGQWQVYENPIKFSHSIQLAYRGIDRLSNEEIPHIVNVRIDDIKPVLSIPNVPTVISPNGDGRFDQAQFVVNTSDNIYSEFYLDVTLTSQNGTSYKVFDNKKLVSGNNSLTWDGKIDGELLPEGIYNIEVVLSDDGGNLSDAYKGTLTYDITPPVVNVLNGVVRAISPNGDDSSDVLQVQYETSDNIFTKDIQVTLQILTGGDFEILKNVENVETPPLEHVISWNGTNALQNGVFDGNYDFQVFAEDPAGNRSNPKDGAALATGEVFIDRYSPETSLEVEGPNYDDDERLWMGKNAVLRLLSSDPAPSSGIQNISYSYNAGQWQGYVQPLAAPQEGVDHSISYRSIDVVGNEESIHTRSIRSDTTPPVTTIEVGDPKESDVDYNLYVSPKTLIILTASDENGVGVDQNFIEIAGVRVASTYTSPINLEGLGDGAYELFYWSKDHLGNKENENSKKVLLDATPPVTNMVVGDPKFEDAENGVVYITSDTELSFNAIANRDDLARTEYRIKDDDWKEAGAFKISDEGEYAVEYRSFDRLGNEELVKASKIIIDNTAPDSALSLSQSGGGGANYVTNGTLISISGKDSGANVSNIEYNIDGGEYKVYTGPFSLTDLGPGTHVISYRAKDRLGNVSESKIYAVQLIDVSIKRENSLVPRTLVFMLQTQDIRVEDPKPNEDLLRAVENALGGYFTIINGNHNDPATVDKFIAEMRTDRYTTYIFATDAYTVKFYDNAKITNMLKELKARIYKGDALLLLTGYSNITDVPWTDFISDFASLGGDDLDDFFGDNSVGLILGGYGRGKIASFGSDVGRLVYGGGFDPAVMVSGLVEVIKEVLPKEEESDAGEVIDVTETFENSGDKEAVINVSEQLPEGWLETKATVGEVLVTSRNFDLTIPAKGSVNVNYLYRPKVGIGEHKFVSQVSVKWSDGLVSTAELTVPYVVKNDLMSMIDELLSGATEQDVSAKLMMLQRRLQLSGATIVTNEDFSELIALVLEAMELTSSPEVKYQLSEIVESLGALQSTMGLQADISVGIGDPNDPSSYHGNTSSGLGSGGGCQLLVEDKAGLRNGYLLVIVFPLVWAIRRRGYGKH